MRAETDRPAHPPIIEPWRIAALVGIVAIAMLFVHAVVPAGAETIDQASAVPSQMPATFR